MREKPKHIYVVGTEKGPVKIGISQDPDVRIHTIQKQSGRLLPSRYVSPLHSEARHIEKDAHNYFSSVRLEGEWFDVPFMEAKEVVAKLVSEYENVPITDLPTQEELADRMFQLYFAFERAKALKAAGIPLEQRGETRR